MSDKPFYYIRFCEDGYPCGDTEIEIEWCDHPTRSVFKPGFNYFKTKRQAQIAAALIKKALKGYYGGPRV